MGKAKRAKLKKQVLGPHAKSRKHVQHSITSDKSAAVQQKTTAAKQKAAATAQQHSAPSPAAATTAKLPFDPEERILLVGEGDFSFSASLAAEHGCTNLTCTSPEASSAAACAQHARAAEQLSTLAECEQAVEFGVDARQLGAAGTAGGAWLRQRRFDAVVFNFPHVGGQSTDVNRQVRANQALVAAFLAGCLRILAPAGRVLVTLFDGQPYELWGLRNLARHVGLRVEQSFRFEPGLYPRYRHARTLGDVKGGGGWRGENRPARTYVLRKEGDLPAVPAPGMGRKRRRREGSTDEEDEDDD